MQKTTIKKIAALAGVSTTTVSYVLNNRPGISQKTRNLVLRIAEQENYVLNSHSNHQYPKFNIYLIIDEFSSFGSLFYSTILDSLSITAGKYGYNIIISNKVSSFRESEIVQAILRGDVDGVILLHDPDAEAYFFLKQCHVPFVVIDSHTKSADFPRVCVDYDIAAYTAVDHLLSLGHNKIAFIGQQTVPDFYISTFHGYRKALQTHHVDLRPEWIQTEACDFESAFNCMKQILNCDNQPTAIFCASDLFALASMNCIQKHGKRVPWDYSVVGIDDLHISQIYYPALSTIHLDTYEMAFKAIELLSKMVDPDSNHVSQQTVFLESDSLIIRESTAPPMAC